MWNKKLEQAMSKLDEDDISREVTIKLMPDVEAPAKQITSLESETQSEEAMPEKKEPEKETVQVPAGVTTPAEKIRHEWYQTGDHVVLTLYVKGVPKDRAAIDIKERTVRQKTFNYTQRCLPLARCRSASRFRPETTLSLT